MHNHRDTLLASGAAHKPVHVGRAGIVQQPEHWVSGGDQQRGSVCAPSLIDLDYQVTRGDLSQEFYELIEGKVTPNGSAAWRSDESSAKQNTFASLLSVNAKTCQNAVAPCFTHALATALSSAGDPLA